MSLQLLKESLNCPYLIYSRYSLLRPVKIGGEDDREDEEEDESYLQKEGLVVFPGVRIILEITNKWKFCFYRLLTVVLHKSGGGVLMGTALVNIAGKFKPNVPGTDLLSPRRTTIGAEGLNG